MNQLRRLGSSCDFWLEFIGSQKKTRVLRSPSLLHVLDARSPNLKMLKYDEGYVFIPGDTDLVAVLGAELMAELGLGGWTVSGLPAGMKWDSKNNTIAGAATKVDSQGNVTPSKVKVTVTSAGKSKMEFVIELTVDPLPVWAVGTFDGYHMEFGATNGTFTATVDKTGKVSGRTAGGIASTTFGAASFGKVFTLDGTNLVYAVDVTVSYKDPETRKTVKAVDTLYLMEDLGTGLGVIGGGDTNGCGCVGIQRAWDRKDLEFPEFDTKALKDPLVLENGITLKFGEKGKVTVAGTVPGDDGKSVSVSGSTYAMPVAWTDEANLIAQVYVYVAPKTNLKTGVSEVYEVLLTVGGSGKIDKVSIAPQIVD